MREKKGDDKIAGRKEEKIAPDRESHKLCFSPFLG